MRALEVDYIVNIKMEMTNVELEEIVTMGQVFLEEYGSDEIHDYRFLVAKLKAILSKVREFERDTTITLGHW